jgi:tetratricopeptide (TPR) repeat protein
LWLLAADAGAAEVCDQPIGLIVSIHGQTEIRAAGRGDWRVARLNEPLCAGVTIRVGNRSRAEVALTNQPKIRIDQNSTLTLVQAPEDRPSLLELLAGSLYLFSRQPRALEIDTPFINAAVEGTEFVVQVEPAKALVTVFEGTVRARNAEGEILVASGHSTVAEAGKAPVPYLLLRLKEQVQWAIYFPQTLVQLADRSASAAGALPPLLAAAVGAAARGDPGAAFAGFERVPEAARDVDFYVYRAAVLVSVGRADEADQDLAQALTKHPDDGRALGLRAIMALARNQPAEALADAERAVTANPDVAAAWIALSYAEQARFRLDKARQAAEQAVAVEPDNGLAWARLAELRLASGDRRGAREAARRARELAPALERVQTVLGFAALAEFRTGEARQAFTAAIALDSENPEPRLGLGLAKIREGALAEGRTDIEIAVALDPTRSLLRSYLGKAYFEERREPLASEQYAIARSLDPNDPTPWFYDALLKQSENRPVEALKDIETAIRLNDNRAVFRSRELLDQDRAARGASLARIYEDLGFRQLGLNQASQSLSQDPANASAHRFLADTYATLPRRETARVSELLQAQLLQDININPVQPSLSVTNLNIFAGGGPARPGLNEFTPLFERNRPQLNVSGEVGNHYTFAGEAVASAVYDQFSISAGQYHYETEGFRENFDLKHDIGTVFLQGAVTPELNLQAEFTSGRTESGDRELRFNLTSAQTRLDTRRDLDRDSLRFGARYSPTPNVDVLASLIYGERKEKITEGFEDFRAKDESIQGESQVLLRGENVNVVAGVGIFDIDQRFRNQSNFFLDPFDETIHSDVKHETFYGYINWQPHKNAVITFGFSYDDYDDQELSIDVIGPKFGIRWEFIENITLRLAAYRSLKPALATNRTIQPTQVAGFNQFFDDFNGTETTGYGAGLDVRFSEEVFGGIEASHRDMKFPFAEDGIRVDHHEDLFRAYLYWTPHREWSVSGELVADLYRIDEGVSVPSHVRTFSAPISLRYFHPSGVFAATTVSPVYQGVSRRDDSDKSEGDSVFSLVDAAVGYRFPHRRGLFGVEVRNLFDSNIKYQDDSYRQLEIGNGLGAASPYFPERAILARLTLSF